MTDNQYNNYNLPSSRPPEPPMRSGYGTTKPISEARDGDTGAMPRPYAANGGADTRGVDVMTEEENGTYGDVRHGAVRQQAQRGVASHGAAAPAKSGSGKAFLFGFLGALLACVLCLGGFALFNTMAGKGDSKTALAGSTDQVVINAVDEGATLAEAVAAKALPSVVAVYNYADASQMGMYGYGQGGQGGNGNSESLTPMGMGSGVVISEDGYILTNYHVVEGAKKLTVTVDGEERDATYVGGDSSSDVAVVKVDNTNGLVAAEIGDSDNLKTGQWVMTIGAPLGLEQSVATGVVSATNRSTIMSNQGNEAYGYYTNAAPSYTYYPNMIQTDAVINPGNSGGALVDSNGKLIGMNAMISSYSGDYAGVGFAIPVNYAMGIANDIIAGKEPTHAALGVSLSQVNEQIAKRYNLSSSIGAYIAGITPGSGAAESDLQVGDIIVAVDGKPVKSTTDVTLDVRAKSVGDTVTVTVDRNGEKRDIDVKLVSDEILVGTDTGNSQQNPQGQQSPYGDNGGNGRNNGYSEEELRQLEELLHMFGM